MESDKIKSPKRSKAPASVISRSEAKGNQAGAALDASPPDSRGIKTGGAAATLSADRICRTQAQAAKYAKVNSRTIRRWKKAGMLIAAIGDKECYIKDELDRFKANEGHKQTDARARKENADADYREKRVTLLERQMADIEKEKEEQIREEILKRAIILKRLLKNIGHNISDEIIKLRPEDAAKKINGEIQHALNIYTGAEEAEKGEI